MNYGFVHCLIKWGTKIQKCFKTAMALSKGKDTYILASELINKYLKRYCHESESETEVTDSPDSCFSDGSDTKTINFGAPDGLLNNSACLNPLPTCCL